MSYSVNIEYGYLSIQQNSPGTGKWAYAQRMTASLEGSNIAFRGRRGIRIAIPSDDITHINGVAVAGNTAAQNMAVIVAAMVPTGPTGPYLELALASFTDFPYPLNGHTIYTPDDLTNWNAAWGSSYTDCVVDNTGKTIRFYGYVGSVITTRGIERLIGVTDTGTLSNIASDCFIGCYNLINFSVSGQFDQSIIGETTGDDGIFGDVIGNTMAITIPQGLMESNGPGSPDGDIEFLIASNTVTVNTF